MTNIGFWYFVPKSGIAFIFLSVVSISIWNQIRSDLSHRYVWIFAVEIILFCICFIIADHERQRITKR